MSDEPLPGATPAPNCWTSEQPQSPCATETPAAGNQAERMANFGALLSAFIASSWCWLPPLLILGGISGAGMTTFLEDYRPIFMAVTFAFLAAAFYLTYRPRRVSASAAAGTGAATAVRGPQSKIMAFNKVMLWVVTVVAVGFLFMPKAGSNTVTAGGEFTPDMRRMVIQITGMTWHTWVPKAAGALESAPGVLAVSVDYQTGQATIGVKKGTSVSEAEILAALESIGYRGEIVRQP